MLKLPKLIENYKIDVFWATQHVLPVFLTKSVKKVLTIHDLVCYEMPETMATLNRWINKLFIPYSIKNSDMIVADSDSTKRGMKKYFGETVDDNKVEVVYLAAESVKVDYIDEDIFFQSHKRIKPYNYLLYVGTLEPRKNINTLLKAYELIRKDIEINLVLCGKVGWKTNDVIDNINNHPFNRDIIYMDYVTNLEKHILMKNCFTFIFPSLYEGFGLPVVETMKLDSIAVVSNSSSLNEIVDNEELKFDKHDYKRLSEIIINLYNNRDKYEDLKRYCKERAKIFNWKKSAEQYIEVFNKVLSL